MPSVGATGGKSTGVGVLSHYPCRNLRVTWPVNLHAEARTHVSAISFGIHLTSLLMRKLMGLCRWSSNALCVRLVAPGWLWVTGTKRPVSSHRKRFCCKMVMLKLNADHAVLAARLHHVGMRSNVSVWRKPAPIPSEFAHKVFR